jgi:hypothetical protein
VVRPDGEKVYGETAIPAGRYRVEITMSPRFKQLMPLLIDVPGYAGVRIHPGNKAADTEGCILPGTLRSHNQVQNSRVAYAALYAQIKAAQDAKEEVWIDVRNLINSA